MPDATQAAFGYSYGLQAIPKWATLGLLLTLLVYLRGWMLLRRTRPEQVPGWRAALFSLGVVLVWVAIASPLDALSGVLLTAHMIQHLLLMAFAPPLLVLGMPMVPMLRGLPRSFVREGLGPFFTLPAVRALERLFASRLFAWLLMNVAFLGWHTPAAYDLALRSPAWHEVEHACFLSTSVLFWWHIVAPWPTVYRASRWMLLPFLLSADVLNTGLSALLSFSGKVLYPAYSVVPRFFGVSVLDDQVAAGGLMWVMGSFSFLGAAMLITVQLASRRGEREKLQAERARQRYRALHLGRQPASPGMWDRTAAGVQRLLSKGLHARKLQQDRPGFDLLRVRGIGAFLRSRYGRQSLQGLSLLIAVAVIVDGLFGHQMGSMNLAGIVPWTYARGIFVLALLLGGNLFCMSCPFMLPRDVAKWLLRRAGWAARPWPRVLRNKWLPVALVVLFFWAYEALALWDSPLRTAVAVLAYFATAFAVDAVFRDASFCKYVCPLGQFNFAASLVSPVEVAPRALNVCGNCATRDCIAGHGGGVQGAVALPYQSGCELHLFLPEKRGNLDCTLCMDCVKACPHDNVGLFMQMPALDLVQLGASDPQRSAVGRYSQRMDVAVLAATVTVAAFASAAVMVVPVANLLDRVGARLAAPVASSLGLLVAFALPAALMGLLALAVRAMRLKPLGEAQTRSETVPGSVLPQWVLALLPLAMGMWAAHLSFHLATAWSSLVPGILQAGQEIGHLGSDRTGALVAGWLRLLPAPDWMAKKSLLDPGTLLGLQMVLLDAGLLGTLYLGWRLAGGSILQGAAMLRGAEAGVRREAALPVSRRLRTVAPWALVILALYGAGIWILLQPMQMRGMVGM